MTQQVIEQQPLTSFDQHLTFVPRRAKIQLLRHDGFDKLVGERVRLGLPRLQRGDTIHWCSISDRGNGDLLAVVSVVLVYDVGQVAIHRGGQKTADAYVHTVDIKVF